MIYDSGGDACIFHLYKTTSYITIVFNNIITSCSSSKQLPTSYCLVLNSGLCERLVLYFQTLRAPVPRVIIVSALINEITFLLLSTLVLKMYLKLKMFVKWLENMLRMGSKTKSDVDPNSTVYISVVSRTIDVQWNTFE